MKLMQKEKMTIFDPLKVQLTFWATLQKHTNMLANDRYLNEQDRNIW